jgi:hypothetical protein
MMITFEKAIQKSMTRLRRREDRDVLARNGAAVRDSSVMYGKQAALPRYARVRFSN